MSRRFFRPLAAVLLVSVVALSTAGLSGPAAADSVDVLTDRVDRLTRDLADLRNQFYMAQSGSGGSAQSLTPAQAGSFESRLAVFEQELRSLTGMVERLNHQQSQLNSQLERMQADVDYRLSLLEGGGGAAVSSSGGSTGGSLGNTSQSASTQSVNTESINTQSVNTSNQSVSTATQGDVQTLGSVAQGEVAKVQNAPSGQPQTIAPSSPAPGADQLSALPAGTPQQQYDYAFGLLRKADYDGAQQALTAFIQQNPNDPLAANAKYWLGETYYVRGNYNEAARAFGVAYQEHPQGPKASDSLLKLGLSLSLLGRNADACSVFLELENRFPNAAANVLQRSQQERGRLGC